MSIPSTLAGINQLPRLEKRDIYAKVIPKELINWLNINPYLVDKYGRDLLQLNAASGSTSVEMSLYHKHGFPDPVLYGHITDTLYGQLHILLYVLNDPDSARFDVDRMPDGTPTRFGTQNRNIEAEVKAMEAGLNPGQIRWGPHLLSKAIKRFEEFVENLGHDFYFVEPLYYHNAVIFERFGFTYQQGRRKMISYDRGFQAGGNLDRLLDGSTPFRRPGASASIRLRSWAIHDGILAEPYTDVTMYKKIGKHAGISTTDCDW